MFYIKTILWGFHFAIFGKFQLQYYVKLICNIEEKVLAKNKYSKLADRNRLYSLINYSSIFDNILFCIIFNS
jgi:hypothetical protein